MRAIVVGLWYCCGWFLPIVVEFFFGFPDKVFNPMSYWRGEFKVVRFVDVYSSIGLLVRGSKSLVSIEGWLGGELFPQNKLLWKVLEAKRKGRL